MKTYAGGLNAGNGLSWDLNKRTFSSFERRSTEDAKATTGRLVEVLRLVLSPITGLLWVIAFPLMTIVTVMKLAWVKRYEKQFELEKRYPYAVAFPLSFAIGFFYVVGFPLIVAVALIRKLMRNAEKSKTVVSEYPLSKGEKRVDKQRACWRSF